MKKKIDWRITLACLAAANFAAGLLAPLSLGAAWAYNAVMWIILPAIGVATTYISVRLGLNNYAAFPLPAACSAAAHWLLIGYPPSSAGMALLNAGVCLVAAAAAQVKNEREKNGKERAQ